MREKVTWRQIVVVVLIALGAMAGLLKLLLVWYDYNELRDLTECQAIARRQARETFAARYRKLAVERPQDRRLKSWKEMFERGDFMQHDYEKPLVDCLFGRGYEYEEGFGLKEPGLRKRGDL